MSNDLHTELEIHATPERVWEVLTDFESYPDWNPFIPKISGPIHVGARLDTRLQPPGGRGMRFRPTLLAAEPAKELRWLGHLIVPGIFDGEHRFRIEPLDQERVRFIQEERFTGILSRLVMRLIGEDTLRGFEAMNQALKLRAEQTTAAGR